MIDISKTRKNLIGVSLISSLMVFLLGGRYLSDAHTQFFGAMQVQSSVAPETKLFEIANSLDQERATIQRILIRSTEYNEELEQLDELSKKTRNLFNQVRREIMLTRSDASERLPHRYSRESINYLIQDLDDRFKRISIASAIIIGQIYLPYNSRDENVRIQMYDAYVNMTVAINNLRKRSHTLPEKNYIDVLASHDIKNAIWDVSDAVNQTTTLMESYLLKYQYSSLNTLNIDNLALRILQQHERANRALADMTEMVQHKDIAGVSSTTVKELKTQYEREFRNRVKQLILLSPEGSDATAKISDWMRISSDTKDKVHVLKNVALASTSSTAESIKRTAAFSLFSNTLLVILCIAMAYASFRVARTIQYQADHDDLTGLPNRRHFSSVIHTLFKKTDTGRGERLVLMTLDLNGFKSINDTMGHLAGDQLLTQVATRLKSTLNDNMIIARMGGDEFSIAYKISDTNEPYQLACRIREEFSHSFNIEDGIVKVNTSIGYSIYPDDASTLKELQTTSDFAMFSAKQSGRKIIQPYDRDIAHQFENRLAIEQDLACAIENDELELFYQPQFNLSLSQVSAVEALIRWNHPTRGTVPPIEFISIAEETGLMPSIGNWVLNEACRQAAVWRDTENHEVRVAVNVSVHQVMQNDFVQRVVDVLQRYNISAGYLELEITESVVMTDITWIAKCFDELKNHGVRIALDDFGTGYSSLNQLQELPLDTLKIDRTFISGLDDNSNTMKSVTATIASIADIYGLETVAEGVESDQQLKEVCKLGIEIAQGYYYSRPLPAHQVIPAIENINELSGKTNKAA